MSKDRFKKLLRKTLSANENVACNDNLLVDYHHNELDAQMREIMENHLDSCPACLALLSQLREAETTTPEVTDWHQIQTRMDNRVRPFLDGLSQQKKVARDGLFERFLIWLAKPIPVVATLTAICGLFLAGTYGYALMSRPAAFHLAQITLEVPAVTRGQDTQDDLMTGLELMQQHNYAAASLKIGAFIRKNPEQFQALFYLGLCKLKLAEESVLWIKSGFNVEFANAGLDYLEAAYRLTGDNPFYQEDCLWYLGKAYLMLGQKAAALEKFSVIVNLPAQNILRRERAEEMIVKIQTL